MKIIEIHQQKLTVKDALEEKASCQVCTKRSDEYVGILEQQKNQMKVFSDVIDKAQNVIALMNGNLNPRTVMDKVYKVYNVSTQANAFISKKDANQNTESVRSDDKETNTAVPDDQRLNQDESVQVKSAQENKLIGTTRYQSVPERKLSTHLLPSVAITRELVTQKIPSVNITATESAPSENSNLGYEVIKHDSADRLQNMISIIRNMRKKDQESQVTDETNGVEENVTPETSNTSKQTESEKSKNLEDPTAQLMWKSYQVHDNAPHDLSLPEIDSAALSIIDDDVYRTYVNPNGKRNRANSKSSKVSSGTSEKKSNANDDQDKHSKSISNSTLNLDNNSKNSIASILTHNRASLNEYKNTQLFDQSRDVNSLYSPPRKWNRNSLGFEKEHRPANTGKFRRDSPDLSNVKLDNAVSANIKGYMAHPQTKISREVQQMPEQIEHKVSKLSKVTERDFSDSTEQMIFSIDKVDIRRKSEFYENQGGKYSLYDMIDSSTSRKKYNPKMRAVHKIKSDFRNYGSSDEVLVTHDVKVQTVNVSTNGNSVRSTNSKESSDTHNTDESIKITHMTDSVEEIVYCSYCSKFCFGRNRHTFHDDAYEMSANRNSIQYSRNIESVKTENIGQLSESRKVDNELNNFLDRKNNLIEDLLISNEKTKISHVQDQNSKASNDEMLDGSVERKRSVRIEAAERNNSTVETFKRGLTSSSANIIGTARPLNYVKEDIIGFVKKSSVDFQQNNKKATTVMNVTLDESTITNSELINGGGGDKVLHRPLENGAREESKSKQESVDLDKIIYCHKTQNHINHSNMKDEYEHSDGEILNKCDCSIGEIRLCTSYPESKFLRDIYNTNQMVVGRNVRNSNWVSYFVKPLPGHKIYASVPINDSSDSFS
ncbi:hypothetical protein FQR65_LT00534 [Abscondita terminalis]|nr:hypothetical protein FQR65_LT00534 [Abscondita terminalis]